MFNYMTVRISLKIKKKIDYDYYTEFRFRFSLIGFILFIWYGESHLRENSTGINKFVEKAIKRPKLLFVRINKFGLYVIIYFQSRETSVNLCLIDRKIKEFLYIFILTILKICSRLKNNDPKNFNI